MTYVLLREFLTRNGLEQSRDCTLIQAVDMVVKSAGVKDPPTPESFFSFVLDKIVAKNGRPRVGSQGAD